MNIRCSFIWMVLVSMVLGSCSIQQMSFHTYKKYAQKGPYDVVIVPGVPYDSVAPSKWFKARVYWATELYKKGIAKNIIFSGAAVHTPYVEGDIMKRYAVALGIPEKHIYSETHAEHTNENICYAWELARNIGYKKIALATDPYQSFMFSLFNKKCKPEVALLPISMDSMRSFRRKLPPINSRSSYVKDFVPVARGKDFFKGLHDVFANLR